MLDKNPKSAIWPSLGVAGHSFAFYAVCALLVLSLVFRGVASADAIALYGSFIAAAYLSPFFGSWLSLRLGLRLTVILGAVLAMGGVCDLVLASSAARPSLGVGHVWLSWGLFGGLGCLALGVGLIKPNLVTMVTRLFPSGSSLVDPALARYYAFTNGGAIAGPLVAGYCAVRWGYSVGFAVALAGECFLLGAMLLGWRALAVAESWSSLTPFGVGSVGGAVVGVVGADPVDPRAIRSALAVLVPFFLLATVGFWPAYHQNGTGLTLWAQQHTRLDMWGFHIPPAWFASINSMMCVLLSVPLSRWFSGGGGSAASVGGSAPSGKVDRSSFVIPVGYALMSLSFVVLLVAARLGPIVSPLWLIGSIVLSTLSELAVSIGGLSRVAKVTPRRYMPLAMSCWYATVALGGIIAGQAGRLPLLSSFVLCSALSACAAVVYLATSFLSRSASVRPSTTVPVSMVVAS
jgi:POT family proton-dependent oligopeptide transporter